MLLTLSDSLSALFCAIYSPLGALVKHILLETNHLLSDSLNAPLVTLKQAHSVSDLMPQLDLGFLLHVLS